MPCWYFDKKDLQKTPSFQDGINAETEAKYRREGARFIMDAGSKMKLHYNTCASGVVYFHRFYLFHSFKEFHRHVMAVCCLFLAGKVEETPKKCKDLIKITQSMLTEEQFAVFGKDAREEVMTLERILLQTIKFDLMVEHPYAYVVKFAKQIKGDKAKIEKMAQMAWTFVNDSLCTTLCLQWEAEVVAVAMMYLTSRLSRFEPTDWQGKPSGYRGKWYEFLVKDVTLELLEDICHQVLDLYSKPHLKATSSPATHSQPPHSAADESTKSTPKTPISPQVGKRPAPGTSQGSRSAESSSSESSSIHHPAAAGHRVTAVAAAAPVAVAAAQSRPAAGESYSQANPYIATQMYSSSFMSQEGTQSIQSLIGGAMGGDKSNHTHNAPHYQKDGSSGNAFQGAAAYQQSHAPPAAAQAPPSSANSSYSQAYPYSGSYQHPVAGYNQNYPVQTGSMPGQPQHAGYQGYDSRSQHQQQQQQYMNVGGDTSMHGQHHPINSHSEDSQSGHSRQHWQ